ncbi:MAG: DUF3575 domain-containing protein [Bacteroidales bacterium]|nr:DUF3575 domain-containing protein [Bacteroidales bacterium]
MKKMIAAVTAILLSPYISTADETEVKTTSGYESGTVAISSNIMSWLNLATLNAEAQYLVDGTTSVKAGVKYNPFSYGSCSRCGRKGVQEKFLTPSVGIVRWLDAPFTGPYATVGALFSTYNVWNVLSEKSFQGRLGGITAGGGYYWGISRQWRASLGLEIMAFYHNTSYYDAPRCGMPLGSRRGVSAFPSDIRLGVSYIIE